MDTMSELSELIKRKSPEDVSRVKELFARCWEDYIKRGPINTDLMGATYRYLIELGETIS